MTTPQWRDAPDQPGIWLSVYFEERFGVKVVRAQAISVRNVARFEHCGDRYFGPIPPDPQQEQP
jgi:hypothetical protein